MFANPDEQLEFIALGACQLGHCAGVSQDEKNACMWTNCTTESAVCLASMALGDKSCGETFMCMVSDLSVGLVTECIMNGSQSGTEAALEFLACYVEATGAGAPCDETEGAALITCVAGECVEQAAACPLP